LTKYASKFGLFSPHVVSYSRSNLYSRHTHPGDLSFHKHHGQGRELDVDKLQTADIVLTTYATVATEFCRGKSSLAKVKWFRIVLDESTISIRSLLELSVFTNIISRSRYQKSVHQAIPSHCKPPRCPSLVSYWYTYSKQSRRSRCTGCVPESSDS